MGPSTGGQPRRIARVRELPIVIAGLVLLALIAGYAFPVAASSGPQPWEDGVVRYYDAAGLGATLTAAAGRWNDSGARVRLVQVLSPQRADVVFEVDEARLRDECGYDCLGYTSSIGRPSRGPVRVLLAAELTGAPRPLSVWVAAHEFGHVLGLQHRDGRGCSVMSSHASESSCAPSLAAVPPTADQLACVPAPADVEKAAELYGGSLTGRGTPCR